MSTGFLIISLLSYLYSGNRLYFGFLPAYICCFLGDILLGVSRDKEGKLISKRFYPGMAAFGLAHVFYIIQLLILLNFKIRLISFIPALILAVATLIAAQTDSFNYGRKAPYCALYSLFVGLFGGLGIEILIMNPDLAYMKLLGIGSILFLMSDCVLAFKYFYKCVERVRKIFGQVEITLYYIAMLLLSVFTLFQ